MQGWGCGHQKKRRVGGKKSLWGPFHYGIFIPKTYDVCNMITCCRIRIFLLVCGCLICLFLDKVIRGNYTVSTASSASLFSSSMRGKRWCSASFFSTNICNKLSLHIYNKPDHADPAAGREQRKKETWGRSGRERGRQRDKRVVLSFNGTTACLSTATHCDLNTFQRAYNFLQII